jgi:wobble nucleotide-excising tRNase
METGKNEIIQEFYKRPGIMKKRIRLEKKLSEAREELDIISNMAGEIILVRDKYGSLY